MLRIVNMFEEMTVLINKEKKDEQTRSDASSSLFNSLLAYVQQMKLTYTKERNLMQAKAL